MLEIQYLRENRDAAVKSLAKRCNPEYANFIDSALKLDKQKRNIQTELDGLLAEINKASKQIGGLMKDGKKDEAETLKARVSQIKTESQDLKDKQASVESELGEFLYQIPNTPHESVRAGKSENDNEEILRVGSAPTLAKDALPHWDLATKYKLIDFELGAKVTGAGFPFYTGQGARVQRALINYFLDGARDSGYEEVIPPLVVNEASGIGTGQLPDKEGQMYFIESENLYLIPTAEVPITNIFRDVILSETDLPKKICGYTPCFRREAGSHGKEVRALNRLHQFDKVEIVQIVHPYESYSALEAMVNHVKGLLESLELPYRILRLCGGDLGFTAALTYDFEVYSAGQDRWLEVSSVSNFETYQSNRLKCRFKGDGKKNQLAHTLNGSALALPRILAAILENNQTENGIEVPKVLRTYTGFDTIR